MKTNFPPRNDALPFQSRAENTVPARCEAVTTADGTNEVFVYGVISNDVWWGDEVTPKQVIDALAEFAGQDVTIRINSNGGVVTAGMAMYNAIISHTGRVTTQIDGIAASAAATILMAGEVRVAAGPGSLMMIHNARGGAWGEKTDMRAYADVLDKMDGSIAGILSRKSGIAIDQVVQLMNDTSWYTAEEALAAGFVSAVGDDSGAENLLNQMDFTNFINAPEHLRKNVTDTPPRPSSRPVTPDLAAPEAVVPEEVVPEPIQYDTDSMARKLRLAMV